jgi:PAS domain S-box-containing protein
MRSVPLLIVTLALFALGIANITSATHVHEVEDGVLWGLRSGNVTAIEVAEGSPGETAGLRAGDILLAVNGQPVHTAVDVVQHQHRGDESTMLSYTILRLDSQVLLDVALARTAPRGSMYFVLAAVGLFTLLVGSSVRLRRPRDYATLHFYWVCVALFGTFTFSFSGPFDRLDWVFYWGDAVAQALLPPLLLHFTMVFPERTMRWPRVPLSSLVPPMYLPAIGLIAGRVVAVMQAEADGQLFSMRLALIDRVEAAYLFVCVAIALVVVMRAFGEISSVTGRRQLRWIAWGTVLGVAPFGFGYALPWSLGVDPPFALQLTAIPLGIIPLTFGSAIVRYRLRDVEVIVKRGLAYAAFLCASVILYVAMLRLVGFAFDGDTNPQNWVIALLATMIIVLLAQPVREAMQDALDRVFFYRDRYDYRRALVGFARDLNTDLDVVRLGQRLVTRVVETLVVDRMALMMADERRGDFQPISEFGFSEVVPALPRVSSFLTRLDSGKTVALDDPMAAAWFTAEEVEFWRDQGIYYFVPCVFEGSAIAVLALGRKDRGEPFNSEDLALLTAVAGQVATAIENGRLYRQLQLKAEEIGRMREFNDNILESLDDGLVVFDEEERIVRWNSALERCYGVTPSAAVGRRLVEVFDTPFVGAVRAACAENPMGTMLFRVPLTARRGASSDDETETSRLLVNVTAVPLQNSTDQGTAVDGTILLIEDVTERIQLEEQLQISEKMASIGVLAAGVAHEVNTPLTGISSFTQMLLEGADPADPRTVLLEKIERQTFRAAKIVNGLLTLSRPGTPGGERIPVDLNVVINDVCSLLEHQFTSASIKVRRELCASPVVVSGIEHRLQQVFLNLFLNARDAMPSGGWLSVTTRLDDEGLVAEVADTGSGIPPEQLARIYDPFFTTKAIGRGTGLGLSITYGIVREHDGSIRCDSTVGQGTRFTLVFPPASSVAARSAAH